jgi:hypothetical protein
MRALARSVPPLYAPAERIGKELIPPEILHVFNMKEYRLHVKLEKCANNSRTWLSP